MQIITGTLRDGHGVLIASSPYSVCKQNAQGKPGPAVLTNVTNGSGAFSFQLIPGAYILQCASDSVAFRVSETSGSVLLSTLIETL